MPFFYTCSFLSCPNISFQPLILSSLCLALLFFYPFHVKDLDCVCPLLTRLWESETCTDIFVVGAQAPTREANTKNYLYCTMKNIQFTDVSIFKIHFFFLLTQSIKNYINKGGEGKLQWRKKKSTHPFSNGRKKTCGIQKRGQAKTQFFFQLVNLQPV